MNYYNLARIVIHRFLGGGFKHFLFSPLPGEMIQFDEHIFQMGWFLSVRVVLVDIFDLFLHQAVTGPFLSLFWDQKITAGGLDLPFM